MFPRKAASRQEQEIFDELGTLCTSAGYLHAIAAVCARDNFVGYNHRVTAKEMLPLFSRERLIRTEISTLIGLMVRQPIDSAIPPYEVLEHYVTRTEELLNELHNAIIQTSFGELKPDMLAAKGHKPLANGAAMREPIFYGGEAAYSSQYRDLAPRKYARDENWINTNKGFSIDNAKIIASSILALLNDKTAQVLKEYEDTPPGKWTPLPGFTFTALEIAEHSGIDQNEVSRFLLAFSLPRDNRNEGFTSLHEFNSTNAYPVLRWDEDRFILLQYYSLVEALYENPFYWMGADKGYSKTAMINRGLFTEEIAYENLLRVFGRKHVYKNVNIYRSKGERFGEIDVLVVFGNRAIVLQAKSKRLTLEARKGNDNQIKDDFKKAVQDAYDQAFSCGQVLGDTDFKLIDGDGQSVTIPFPLKEIYPVCIVADHYPALNYQARHFLQYRTEGNITAPIATDVFALDVMTEMLDTPLRLLSYLNLRVKVGDKLLTSHELTTLSYHLKHNLWLSNEFNLLVLEDDVSVDLDVAMLVRRDGLPGNPTPDGILTRQKRTTIGRIITEIEARPDPGTLDFGLMLLTLREDTTTEVSRAIDKVAVLAKATSKSRDVTFGFGPETGLTVHCNPDPLMVAAPALERHCQAKKYAQRATTWFGLLVNPGDGAVRFGIGLDFPWKHDDSLEDMARSFRPAVPFEKLDELMERAKKIGRNDPCRCGSGLKYKRCCLRRV